MRLAYGGNSDVRSLISRVADCENALNGSCKARFVRRYCILSRSFKLFKSRKVGILSDSHNNAVKADFLNLSLNGFGTAASAFIGLAEPHFLKKRAGELSVLAEKLQRICKVLIDYSLLLGFENLLRVGGHFVLGTAVNYIHILSAEPYRCTAGVHSGVAAAADRDIFAY